MIDYNIYGMGFADAADVLFRLPLPGANEPDRASAPVATVCAAARSHYMMRRDTAAARILAERALAVRALARRGTPRTRSAWFHALAPRLPRRRSLARAGTVVDLAGIAAGQPAR